MTLTSSFQNVVYTCKSHAHLWVTMTQIGHILNYSLLNNILKSPIMQVLVMQRNPTSANLQLLDLQPPSWKVPALTAVLPCREQQRAVSGLRGKRKVLCHLTLTDQTSMSPQRISWFSGLFYNFELFHFNCFYSVVHVCVLCLAAPSFKAIIQNFWSRFL